MYAFAPAALSASPPWPDAGIGLGFVVGVGESPVLITGGTVVAAASSPAVLSVLAGRMHFRDEAIAGKAGVGAAMSQGLAVSRQAELK